MCREGDSTAAAFLTHVGEVKEDLEEERVLVERNVEEGGGEKYLVFRIRGREDKTSHRWSSYYQVRRPRHRLTPLLTLTWDFNFYHH